MPYTTEGTAWPTSVTLPDSIKDLIAVFYTLADDKSADAGPRMAKEIFTADAHFGGATAVHKGSEDIAHSRVNAWKTVTSRRHVVKKVFAHDAAGHDLLLLAELEQGFVNGKSLLSPFVVHVVVDADSVKAGSPRFSYMQVYADTAPVIAALKG
ncbi:hypothetical protein A1O3_08209 [Capronia epimyces CBS 606.96]|uniref:SnoaL-like domain-containing protein n=1 Tax=Capronia epimyces CBS 606.96 TaxID=1182542 RepID=W9YC69_9EURO|nr:uncharacterized protein A1O3_08209 [Capronia epimyces CBS 606.96]EXJ79924.1 hypothetical protein A1O3_08209 [Capronia epimyces CBS 606.96]